jgi:hypothetical protein
MSAPNGVQYFHLDLLNYLYDDEDLEGGNIDFDKKNYDQFLFGYISMLRNVEVYQTSPLSNAENKAKIMQN